jgi:hypothetical protein
MSVYIYIYIYIYICVCVCVCIRPVDGKRKYQFRLDQFSSD